MDDNCYSDILAFWSELSEMSDSERILVLVHDTQSYPGFYIYVKSELFFSFSFSKGKCSYLIQIVVARFMDRSRGYSSIFLLPLLNFCGESLSISSFDFRFCDSFFSPDMTYEFDMFMRAFSRSKRSNSDSICEFEYSSTILANFTLKSYDSNTL